MTIEDSDFVYRYTLQEGEIDVKEGEVIECGNRKFVQFEAGVAPVKCPRAQDFGRVWKDGKTLWLPERNNEEARKLFTKYGVDRIRELQQEIDDISDMIAFVKGYKFRCASKCFVERKKGSGASGAGKPKKKKSKSEGSVECERRMKNAWDASDFVDAESYVERKIEMLQKEMYIMLTAGELAHLKSLKTQSEIDIAVRSILNRHWEG